MAKSSLRIGLWLFLFLLLLLPDFSHAASQGRSWKLSYSQRQFSRAYGNPELFMLVFDYPQGRGAAVPRRIESWIWLSRAVFVIFDNGFFAEEQQAGAAVKDLSHGPRTRLKPSNFHHSMKEQDVIRAYGKPGSVETGELGVHRFRTLRYLKGDKAPGILNVTFYDGKLSGVVAGFAVQPTDMEGLKRELRRGRP